MVNPANMKTSNLTQSALALFWIAYAAVGAWVLLVETVSVQRDLLLILGGFTILAIIATAALLKRDDLSDVD